MQNQKKKEINISTMKTHQTPNKWHHLTCIKCHFQTKNDTQTGICQSKLHNYKTHLNHFCLYLKLIYPSSFEKLYT